MGCFKWFCETIPNKSVWGTLAKRSRENDSEGEIEILDMAAKEPATPRHLLSNVVNVLTPRSIDTAEALARSQLPTVRPMINPDVKISAKTTVALRTLLNSPTAGFKSVYQARAVQLYLNCQTDLFVILPTGGGKSLTFELAPLLEPEGTTILIIPFVALMTGDEEKSQEGIADFPCRAVAIRSGSFVRSTAFAPCVSRRSYLYTLSVLCLKRKHPWFHLSLCH
jgi:hypothetical protein